VILENLITVPRVSLRQLAYFVAIADTGTLSGAAQRMRVSQSAVSLSLGELERVLRVQLCVRRKAHGITLTPSGNHVLRQARELLHQADELEASASGAHDELNGVLVVGGYVTLAPTVLLPLMQGFGSVHPGLAIDFAEGTQDTLEPRILSGELDLAVMYHMDLSPRMARAVLFTLRPHVLLPADHPLVDRPEVSLHDLEPEPMVLLDAPPSSHHTLALCQRAGMVPLVRYQTSTLEMARALVGRGMGYCLLVTRPPNDRTYEGLRVVPKEIAEPVEEALVVLAWPREARLSRQAREFVGFCQDNLHRVRMPRPD
jgi:DNA-binding transcriptional LysR family regulator